MTFKVGDWVVFGLSIGQIKEIGDTRSVSFSDGSSETHGDLLGRCRHLTLKGKRIIESFDYWYNELRKIDGEAGFNYPRICQYFEGLALKAIDNKDNKVYFDKGRDFVKEAQEYKCEIDGIKLFRQKIGY